MASIAWSTRGDLLQYADPRWVTILARGASWLSRSLGLGVVLLIVWIVVRFGGVRSIPLWLIGAPVAVGSIAGLWLVTTPDPRDAGHERIVTMGVVVRTWILATVLIQAAHELSTPSLASLPRSSFSLFLALVWLIGLIAVPMFASRLARRLGDSTLPMEIHWVAGALIGCIGFFALLMVLAMRPGSLPAGFEAIFAVWPTIAFGCVAFALWSIALARRFRVQLTDVALQARANAADSAGERSSMAGT